MNNLPMFSPLLERVRRRRGAGAALLLALYLARVLLEFALPLSPTRAEVVLSVALAALIGGAAGVALTRLTRAAWPALLLLAYILSPAISPELAGVAGVLALGAWLAARPLPGGWHWDVAALLGGFAAYVLTVSPGLLPADAGEFQLVVNELGVAHPPGYPLYTLLGWAFARLPLGEPALRANLFSALLDALTLAVVSRAARRETGSGLAGLAAALTLGAATSFWLTATQASIRPMTALLTALLLDALLAFRRAAPGRPRDRALLRFAFWLGLGLSHHGSLLFVAGVLAAALLAADPGLIRQPRRWVRPAVALAAGFAPWLYLPLRAGAALAPGDLNTWEGFWNHVLARGFEGDLFYFRTLDALAERLATMADVLAYQWHGVALAAAVVGAMVMLWRDRWLLAALGGAFALHTVVAATYRAPQTVEYMMPAYVCLAVALGWLAGAIHHAVRGVARLPSAAAHPYLVALVTSAALLGGALTLSANLPSLRYLHADEEARAFAEALLAEAPEGAVILANWHRVTPLWTVQAVERQRPDVESVYVYPEGAEPLGATWARRAGEYLRQGRPVVVQSYYPDAYAASGYRFEPQVGGPGWVVRDAPRHALPAALTALDTPLTFAGGALALLSEPLIAAGAGDTPSTVILAWQVAAPPEGEVTSFLHAVDAESAVVRQDDVPLATANAAPGEIILARYTLYPAPGDLTLLAGLYVAGAEGVEPLPAAGGQERVPVGTLSGASALPLPPPTENPRDVRFADGLTLTGFDYDRSLPGRARLYLHWAYRAAGWADFDLTLSHSDTILATARFRAHPGDHFSTAHDLPPEVTGVRLALEEAGCGCLSRTLGPFGVAAGYGVDLPGPHSTDRYVPLGSGIVLTGVHVDAPEPLAPGDRVAVALTFRAAAPLADDYVVKVDLIGAGWAWRAQSDHIPATGAMPTLKWVWNSRVTDRHSLTVPPDVGAAGARLELLLYDHFTARPLPLLDPALAARGQTLTLWVEGE